MTVYAVANHIKIESRNEPVLPADLNFITGGNTGQLASFIPQSSQGLANTAVSGVIWLVVICIIMQFIDGRNAVIYCSWRHPFTGIKNLAGTLTRIVAACCSFALCFPSYGDLATKDTGQQISQKILEIVHRSGMASQIPRTMVLL